MDTKKTVIELLKPFGVEVAEDDFTLLFLIQSITQDILNYCNLKELPKELEHVVVRRVVANLLNSKLQTSGEGSIEVEKGIKSITEGDVSVSYDTSLDKGVLISSFIKDNLNYGMDNLYSFRDFRW
ncbi:MAG: hypothetical protein E6005_03855 [Peptostreptococcus sp.]|uniref:hypothetical protein n=1 Tax=Peptostreptococcus TaxID=1257 RepID=UPI00233038D2|nr:MULTISPECIES: hypothetical protein [Peptostreptococcus]MDB8821383.1 hypothetical protein [Peptostreptococcus anaerobius]MDB8825971.1 hypothetical protein [Peptostreptococcus anaerobius]MDB8827868.1 hypothetical protein [Peptostreptococcus anaerobius]MDB8829686.1 hypothetical protein [Peptostreptococcus anaerobius]MDB8831548.1 hypothetical protein [Peptostreptococcus anaerobius]